MTNCQCEWISFKECKPMSDTMVKIYYSNGMIGYARYGHKSWTYNSNPQPPDVMVTHWLRTCSPPPPLILSDADRAKLMKGEILDLKVKILRYKDALQDLVIAEHRFEEESGRELNDPISDAVKEAERVLREEA